MMNDDQSTKKELETLHREIKKYKKIIMDLRRNTFEEEYLLLRRENEELRKKLNSKEELIDSMTNEKEGLENKVQSQQKLLNELTQASNEIKGLIQDLKKRLETVENIKIEQINPKETFSKLKQLQEEQIYTQNDEIIRMINTAEKNDMKEDPPQIFQFNKVNAVNDAKIQNSATFRSLREADLSGPIYYIPEKRPSIVYIQKDTSQTPPLDTNILQPVQMNSIEKKEESSQPTINDTEDQLIVPEEVIEDIVKDEPAPEVMDIEEPESPLDLSNQLKETPISTISSKEPPPIPLLELNQNIPTFQEPIQEIPKLEDPPPIGKIENTEEAKPEPKEVVPTSEASETKDEKEPSSIFSFFWRRKRK